MPLFIMPFSSGVIFSQDGVYGQHFFSLEWLGRKQRGRHEDTALEQVEALCRQGEPKTAHAPQPAVVCSKSRETLWAQWWKWWWVPGGKMELTEGHMGHGGPGLDGAEPCGQVWDWPITGCALRLPIRGLASPWELLPSPPRVHANVSRSALCHMH